ncbi:MAG TPA: alanine--tRNA ligase [Solirubrobacterales bacterium]
MKVEEIRRTYLSFFEERGHKIVPSASLIPSVHDPSVLLTTAGMQPFKPYFRGEQQPPAPRVTDYQRCFRTVDIDEIGNTARHLTFFEMLGNWSFGDYFKEQSIQWGWELSTQGFGFDPEQIWATVFAGDEELGLGPDTEAIEIWKAIGLPEERIVALPRSENFWQGGVTGPCGPCSEMYLDRGESFGRPGDLPGDDTDRFLEYWNHVFMSYDLAEDGSLSELPKKNIDTGMGLERMAAILQDVPSVFDTDALRPLVELAEELSGRSYDEDQATTRAMRILADHTRGTAALIADGVVPSNEDRGYVLRRIMRRAIHQGRSIGLEAPFMERFADRALDLLAPAYPELAVERDTVLRWATDEEESFGRTLDRGMQMVRDLIRHAHEDRTSWVDAEDAFRLHDTYGFPYDLTKELLAEQGLSVDDEGFEELMEEQRSRARMGIATAHGSEDHHGAVLSFASAAPPSRFVGYEKLRAETSLLAAEGEGGRVLVKLEESPFYPEGGGQVADSGEIRWDGGSARVADVYRIGEDQAVELDSPLDGLGAGTRVEAEVDHVARFATMRNHTATHLLHAALRERLGTHVRQAGSAVRPDKLRFDFTHGAPLSDEELRDIGDRVNDWIKESHAVRALEMSRMEAERLGAMALFGEKYGDWVRVIEVEGVSRELCGGTHVPNTAAIGILAISSEGSSAANVRRIEALTGPAAIDWFRSRSRDLSEVGRILGSEQDPMAAARRAAERVAELEEGARQAGSEDLSKKAEEIAASGHKVGGITVFVGRGENADQRALLDLADRIKSRAGAAAVVLGGAGDGKAALVASFSKEVTDRDLSAVDVIKGAAQVIGGGGGGRDNVAQAGGRDPAKLDEALAAARKAIEDKLSA